MKTTLAKQILSEAEEAGMRAGMGIVPNPMVVRSGNQVIDVVDDGMCGFAWVNVKGKGNGASFISALKKLELAGDQNSYRLFTKDSYLKGFTYWVRDHKQSYERKRKHAEAMVEVLRNYGIDAWAGSRLD